MAASSRITTPLYDALFRRNQVFLGAIFAAAFVFEIGFDTSANKVWDQINKGRQWKDIKGKYLQKEDDDE